MVQTESKLQETLSHPQRVVLIDDDASMASMLLEYLGAEGYPAVHAATAEDGFALAQAPDAALVLLDVHLPDGNGFDLLRKLREVNRVPVIMLTMQADVPDRVKGLESGADDYICKPFVPVEVLARIRSLFRRQRSTAQAHSSATPPLLALDDLTLASSSRVVRQAGKIVECTAAEFEVLKTLVSSAGQVVSKDDLTRTALQRDSYAGDRGVDNLVHSLRKKLGARIDGGERFRAIRSVGYTYLIAEAGVVSR